MDVQAVDETQLPPTRLDGPSRALGRCDSCERPARYVLLIARRARARACGKHCATVISVARYELGPGRLPFVP